MNDNLISIKEHPLYFKYLEEDFYAGMRNEMTLDALKYLSHLAKKICEPDLFGTYQNDVHYAKTLDLMLRSTAETRHRGIFLNRLVLPLLPYKNRLLDIGPGNGQLTSWIGNQFQYITAIDTNKKVIDTLNTDKNILRKRVFLEKIHGSILNAGLPDNYYDLSLLSHVLYYIESAKWLNIVERAYSAIKQNGIVAIALSGDQFGKAELIKRFNGHTIDVNSLAKKCMMTYGQHNVRIFTSKESIITLDLTSMLHIAGFFLYDANCTAEKSALVHYINTNCRQIDGRYRISSNQKFILINKI